MGPVGLKKSIRKQKLFQWVVHNYMFSVAKATLESLMSLGGVVISNLGCGYIENGVVIFCLSVRHKNLSAYQNHAYQPNLSLSVNLYIHLSQKPLSLSESSQSAIISIYWSLRYLLAILPISNYSYQPSWPPFGMVPDGHYIYQLSDLLSRLLSHFGLFIGNERKGLKLNNTLSCHQWW